MKSKKDEFGLPKPKPTPLSLRHDDDKELFPNEPKTPHEEVMFVMESTNEIVSKHSDEINRIREILGDILKILEEME